MKSYMKTGCCILFVLGILLIISCGESNNSSATTAKEFVQKYSQAYKDENVGTIAKMTVPGKDQTEESFKDETKKDIKSRGFGYTAWTRTRYLSEEDRGRYIRVNVEIRGARSSIVLVKQEGVLKLVLNPSDYE